MIQTGLKPTIYCTRDPNGAQTHNLPHSRSEPNPQSTALVIRTGFKPTIYRTWDQNRAQTHNLPHSRSEQGSNHNLPHSRSERDSNSQSTALSKCSLFSLWWHWKIVRWALNNNHTLNYSLRLGNLIIGKTVSVLISSAVDCEFESRSDLECGRLWFDPCFKPTIYRTWDQNRAQTHNLPHSRSEQGSNHNLPHSRSERDSNSQSTALEIRTLTVLPMMRLPSRRE
jgi:hypothetical protein